MVQGRRCGRSEGFAQWMLSQGASCLRRCTLLSPSQCTAPAAVGQAAAIWVALGQACQSCGMRGEKRKKEASSWPFTRSLAHFCMHAAAVSLPVRQVLATATVLSLPCPNPTSALCLSQHCAPRRFSLKRRSMPPCEQCRASSSDGSPWGQMCAVHLAAANTETSPTRAGPLRARAARHRAATHSATMHKAAMNRAARHSKLCNELGF